jgi:hypothetical protein
VLGEPRQPSASLPCRPWRAGIWLDCLSQRDIADIIGREFPAFVGLDHKTIGNWAGEKAAIAANSPPPDSRQHFDIWQFQAADDDAGAQSYFGALPPQVLENLLWFFTEPGDIVASIRNNCKNFTLVPAPASTMPFCWRAHACRWHALAVPGRRSCAAGRWPHVPGDIAVISFAQAFHKKAGGAPVAAESVMAPR